MSNTLATNPAAKASASYVPASDSEGPFALIGRHADGSEAWYSGRAGSLFVEGPAFTYASLEGARRRAESLNAYSALHGWLFVAVGMVG